MCFVPLLLETFFGNFTVFFAFFSHTFRISSFFLLLLQEVFCGYDEDKVYTYIFYRDTVTGELILFLHCLLFKPSTFGVAVFCPFELQDDSRCSLVRSS